MNFANLWQHPKTTIAGFLIAAVTITGVLTQQGISLGTAGTGSVVALIGALASAFLGILAEDPQKKDGDSVSTQKLGALMLIAILLMGTLPTVGCTKQQKISVAQEIVNWMPSVTSGVNTISATVAVLEPGAALVLGVSVAGFDALSVGLQAAAKDYLANPNQTSLEFLQAEIVKFQQSVNTSLLQVAGIKNVQSQKMALAAVNALATVVSTILALVQSISSKTQLSLMASRTFVNMASVRILMDEGAMYRASQRVTTDMGWPISRAVTPAQFFAYEAQSGF